MPAEVLHPTRRRTPPRRQTLLALAALAVALVGCTPADASTDVVSLDTARAELEAGRAVLIDIREPQEHATGVAEGNNVNLAIESGVQDPMSVQIAVMQALMLGQTPSRYAMVDKQEIKTYEYRSWGRERITTPIGPLETVIWSSARVGSNRVTKVWYAAELGYLPVRAERRRGDKLEWAMNLKTLKSSVK